MKIRIRRTGQGRFQWFCAMMALFFVSSFALLEDVSISIPAFSSLKFPILYAGAAFLLPHINLYLRNVLKKKYFYILCIVMLLCAMLALDMWQNQSPSLGSNPMRSTVRLILFLVELFLLAILISETGSLKSALNLLYWYTLVLVIITDFLLLTRLVTFRSATNYENYLLGTKFSTVYTHMYLLALWMMRRKDGKKQNGWQNWFYSIMVLLFLVVSIRVDCMTGVLGFLLLLALHWISNIHQRRMSVMFSSPAMLTLSLIASILFPFIAERIVSIPTVTYLIQEVLGRELNLTGRMAIFQNYGRQMGDYWMWGVGYGNGNTAAEWMFRCANAQNALLHWILQIGIPTTIVVTVLFVAVFHQLSRYGRRNEIMPIVLLLYVFLIMGMVETTMNMCFFLWITLIFVHVNEKRSPAPEYNSDSPGKG